MLIAQLALDPEHAEVVTEDGVDIEAVLVVLTETIAISRRGERRRELRSRNRDIVLGVEREQDAPLDAGVERAIGRHCGRGDCHRGRSGQKKSAHVKNPFLRCLRWSDPAMPQGKRTNKRTELPTLSECDAIQSQ